MMQWMKLCCDLLFHPFQHSNTSFDRELMIKFFSKFMVIMYNNFLKATLSIIIAITVPFVACTSGICCYAGVANFNVLNLIGFWYHFFCTNLLSDLPSAKLIVFLFVY